MKNFTLKPIVAATMLALSSAAPMAYADKDKDNSDLWSKAKLTTTYTLNTHLNPFDIDVDVNKGKATLRGTVESSVERDLAEELALGIEGITTVDNQLKIDPNVEHAERDNDFSRTMSDANITAKVKSRLLWNRNTHGMQINVDTDNGMVTLKGEVDSKAEADLASRIAQNTDGVRGVNNKLTIDKDDDDKLRAKAEVKANAKADTDNVSDGWITTKVKSSLIFDRDVDGDIDVRTERGVVYLKGSVDNERAKKKALDITKDIRGVKEVKAELKVRDPS